MSEEDWMWEDFLSYLDDNNLACINLKDFVEWVKLYDIPIEVRCLDNIREDQDDRLRNTTPDEYVLSEKDYYRGVRTILNSEIAALKVA